VCEALPKRNPLVPGDDHVENWIDRLGLITFISDEPDAGRMSPAYYFAAIEAADRSGGRIEASSWWM